MRKSIVCTLAVAMMALCAEAQPKRATEWGYENVAPRRTEFITYSTRNLAEKGDRTAERYYINLEYRLVDAVAIESDKGTPCVQRNYEVDLPIAWRDRDVFLHTEGGAAERAVYVNGKKVGVSRDDRTPSEFFISSYLGDGTTKISIVSPVEPDLRPADMVAPNPTEVLFLYSQPPVRIHDVLVRAVPDEGGKHGVLQIDVVVSSSRRTESLSVGYDIYSPEKELKYYDLREIEIPYGKTDTVHFRTNIYGAMERLWSAESPKLYDVTIYTKRGRIMTEYLNLKVGFGQTTYDGENIYRNGKPIKIAPVRYNSASTRKQTEADIKHLKAEKYNTIYVSYPQPWWFYDICDSVGVYVVEQANINTDAKGGDVSRRGSLTNNPQWLGEFLERQKAAYYRTRIHPCIIAWSLGAPSGGGYNMYKCYEWFKSVESERPVVYRDGDWNTDITLPDEH